MNGFLIFLAVALWFGLSIRKAYRKQLSELESETAPTAGTVKNAFESLFDEAAKEEETDRSSFANEAASAGYYSYECTVSNTKSRATARPAQQARVAMRVVERSEEADATAFDLRQAVIYQTILTNKYLSDKEYCDN